jgi:uracil phosphoribosyltransferase
MSTNPERPGPAPTQGVGPDYKADSQKPTATVSTEVEFDNVTVLPQTPQLIALLSCVFSQSGATPDPKC